MAQHHDEESVAPVCGRVDEPVLDEADEVAVAADSYIHRSEFDGGGLFHLRLTHVDELVDRGAAVLPDEAVDPDYAPPLVLRVGRPRLSSGVLLTDNLHNVSDVDA